MCYVIDTNCILRTCMCWAIRFSNISFLHNLLHAMSTALRHTATHRNTLQHRQHTATSCTAPVMSTVVSSECTTLRHTTPHCNTLQHTATRCNTFQHTSVRGFIVATDSEPIFVMECMQHGYRLTATHCNTTTRCNTLQHTATHCSHGRRCGYRLWNNLGDWVHGARLLAATHCNTLQHTSPYNILQHTATHCNALHTTIHCTLQHTTHCNTPQSWALFLL